MLDVELMLAHDGSAGVAKQLVVAEQRARNGILDGGHANDRRVTLDLLVDLLEGGTADNLYLLVLEILMGRDVVERPQFALYCYPFHIVFDAPAARFYVQQSCGLIAPAARFKWPTASSMLLRSGSRGSMRYARFNLIINYQLSTKKPHSRL